MFTPFSAATLAIAIALLKKFILWTLVFNVTLDVYAIKGTKSNNITSPQQLTVTN